MGCQPLYNRGSLPGLDRVTTVTCLKALGKTPSAMQPSAIARAAGRMNPQAFLTNASGTPSGPGVLEAAPRKASLSSTSSGGAASLAAHPGGRWGPSQAGREPSCALARRKTWMAKYAVTCSVSETTLPSKTVTVGRSSVSILPNSAGDEGEAALYL